MAYNLTNDRTQTNAFAEWTEQAGNRKSFELSRRPLIAILDTSCVRTGLKFQLERGRPPASIWSVQDGIVKLFMEYETLEELCRKLPKFSLDLKVPISELRRILNEDWLSYIRVVKIPDDLRSLDPRALEVRDLDADDYPAAALATLLSPCILLTHNHNDFTPLGVSTWTQGVDAVIAAIDIRVGERHLQAAGMIPAAPVIAAFATTKWASEKIGPSAWLILGLIFGGGIYAYRQQPEERRGRIKEIARTMGLELMEQRAVASAEVRQARDLLRIYAVAGPEQRTSTSAIFRELAITSDSLSAQQLADILDDEFKPSVPHLRSFLHGNDELIFTQVRRGGFVLGRNYAFSES
jgi:hypothetical protein